MPLLHRMPISMYWQELRRSAEQCPHGKQPVFPLLSFLSASLFVPFTALKYQSRVAHSTLHSCPLQRRAAASPSSTFSYDESLANRDMCPAMSRPLKKKNGVVAGMPRSSGVRNSPIGSSHADGEGLVRRVVFPHVILTLATCLPQSIFALVLRGARFGCIACSNHSVSPMCWIMLLATRRGLTCAHRTATTVPPAVAPENSSAVTVARALIILLASILPKTRCRTGSGTVEHVPLSHCSRLLVASSPSWCAALRRGIQRPTNFTDRSGNTSKMSSRVMTESTRKTVLHRPKQSKHHETSILRI